MESLSILPKVTSMIRILTQDSRDNALNQSLCTQSLKINYTQSLTSRNSLYKKRLPYL